MATVRRPLVRAGGKTKQLPAGDSLDKAVVGLGSVDNTSDLAKPISTLTQTALNGKATTAQGAKADSAVQSVAVGAANGVAPLGADSKIASAYLPSYVDDVLEFTKLAAMPAVGESGKIYVALDTNREYRWSGSTYIQLVASPGTTDNVPEGTTNLYFTAARVLSTLLAGLATATATVITAGDSILIALGKLQAQISNKLDATATAAAATKLATARAINGVNFDGTANITVADSSKLPLTGGQLTGSLTTGNAAAVIQSYAGLYAGNGAALFDGTGNSYGTVWGGYLSNYLAGTYIQPGNLGSNLANMRCGNLGSWALAVYPPGAVGLNSGVVGSNLIPCSSQGGNAGAGTTLPGNWYCCGYIASSLQNTLWQRYV